jgi:hypothetical protein
MSSRLMNTVWTESTAQIGSFGGDVLIAKIKPLHTHPNLSSAVLAFTLLSSALAYAQVHKSGHWSYDGDEDPATGVT